MTTSRRLLTSVYLLRLGVVLNVAWAVIEGCISGFGITTVLWLTIAASYFGWSIESQRADFLRESNDELRRLLRDAEAQRRF